jgi:hypothetical protein
METMTIEQIKAKGYDHVAAMQFHERELAAVNVELNRRAQVPAPTQPVDGEVETPNPDQQPLEETTNPGE